MNDNRLDDPCILFALRRESAPFRRAFRPGRAFPGSPCPALFCGSPARSVLVVETGVGQKSVARVLDWLLANPKFDGVPYEPRLIVFAGFAGALSDRLHLGDMVLAEDVVDQHGNRWRTTWPEKWAEGCGTPPLHRGRVLTVDRMIATPEEKRQLGEQHLACAVEMESFHFAVRCTQAGIPFACLRVISDEVDKPLSPALTSLLSGGSASPWRVLRALVWRPTLLPELLRLARDTRRASEQLGAGLRELLMLPRETSDGAP